MNLEGILGYEKPKENFYDILGCSQTSSIEQINREYKIKALQLHPDKNSDPKCVERFRMIQKARETLTDVKLRKTYDLWLNSGICMPFEQFQSKGGHSMHWAPPRRNVRLGLGHESTLGQGSESIRGQPQGLDETKKQSSLLSKFRTYEI